MKPKISRKPTFVTLSSGDERVAVSMTSVRHLSIKGTQVAICCTGQQQMFTVSDGMATAISREVEKQYSQVVVENGSVRTAQNHSAKNAVLVVKSSEGVLYIFPRGLTTLKFQGRTLSFGFYGQEGDDLSVQLSSPVSKEQAVDIMKILRLV